MANFDRNQWYHIYYNKNNETAFMGGELHNRTAQAGTTFFQTFDPKEPAHHWQFYRVEDSKFYLLRTMASGAEGFLGTRYSETEDTPGKTVPYMIRGNVSDDSIYWNVGTFPDGTFFLSNKANKTTYHLTRKANALGAMTSKTDASLDLPGQHFSFDTMSAIDDENFSTVSLPSTTATATSSSTPTASPGAPNDSSSGLSPGAKAGIGIGVALIALILLVVAGLFFWRRHRKNRGATQSGDLGERNVESVVTVPYEMPQNEVIKYEAYGTPTAELQSERRPAELPAEVPRK
ncbi:hypothetical protein P171DRAFT_222790 [Karstenula rhodostoma CBS 690.94]|uniref:Ricin B lectin domain-containing protein n=1 Tax=Karstenula rhodostoma CBS 690.94 TaxID=1392251 RepID=A0A9P4PRS4_9PLEO|nr:hypothetical protein P171DRAFT_222790 [Karstenula rhodostoma CBS 690.94]